MFTLKKIEEFVDLNLLSYPMKSSSAFYSEYVKLIELLDSSVISLCRANLLASKNDEDQQKWKNELNLALDERLRFMSIRDKFSPSA